MITQFECLDDELIVQALTLQMQITVPTTPVFAIKLLYAPKTKKWQTKKFPIIAMRNFLQEKYIKDQDIELDENGTTPALHNCSEFEENGYEFLGKTTETDFVYIDQGRSRFLNSYPDFSHNHNYEDKTINEISITFLSYFPEEQPDIQNMKKELLDYHKRLKKNMEDE